MKVEERLDLIEMILQEILNELKQTPLVPTKSQLNTKTTQSKVSHYKENLRKELATKAISMTLLAKELNVVYATFHNWITNRTKQSLNYRITPQRIANAIRRIENGNTH